MCALKEYNLNEILQNVAQFCDLLEWHYSLREFESIGQNYFGILVPLYLIGTDGTEKEVKLSLVIKLAPTDKRFRVSDAVTRMFDREMFVYRVVLSKYREIQKGLSVVHFVIPTCYYIHQKYCEEVIVMQDMREDGYIPYTGQTFLDLDHMIVSLKSLAKFHAMSFILKQIDEKLYTEIEQKCVPLSELADKRFLEVLNDRLLKALEKFADTEYVSLLSILQRNCVEYIKQTAEFTAATCICHGDMWKENILFKYRDTKPVEACIIDYQTTRTCSLAYDVLYLITSSTDSTLRRQHFGQLLDTYYETFDNYIKTAGYGTEALYPRSSFDNDLKVVAPACLIVANTALWLSNGLQQEGHVRSKIILSTCEEMSTAVQKYTSVVKDIIDDFSMYGYLNV
ncbi:uncharacterized protein LOC134746875 [Cydia strobilella]|uniref:uncharacterized protein LOC134746875 n=1 Tax=Cydia strobilella TaxID=1100964 RepID=UPI003003BA9E